MTRFPGWLRAIPPLLVLWVVVSWPIGLAVEPGRLARPGELEYLVGDLMILLPLAALTTVALRRSAPAGPGLLLVTLGALGYDATHFAVHLIRGTPDPAVRVGVGAGLVAVLSVVGLGIRAVLAGWLSRESA